MSEHAQMPSRRNSLFWRAYMLSWAFLAGAALTYLGAFALHPDNRDRLLTNPMQSDQESNRADLARARLDEQVRTLRETVASLRSDLARMAEEKAKPAQATETAIAEPALPPGGEPLFPSDQSLTTGSIIVRAPTEEPTQEYSSAPAAGDATPGAEMGNPEPSAAPALPEIQPVRQTEPTSPPRSNLAITPLRAGKLPPLPGYHQRPAAQASAAPVPAATPSQPLILNGATVPERVAPSPAAQPQLAPARPVRTVALAKPSPAPMTFGEPRVMPRTVRETPPAPRAAALSLSTATSVTGLRASWLVLTTRHASSFAGYTPRYIEDTATGTYRLIAGPIADRTEADRVCTNLRIEGVSCGVTDYGGNPF